MKRKWSRRVFLKLALGMLAGACSARSGELPSTTETSAEELPPLFALAAPSPSPIPTALPAPDGAAVAFLSAWSAGDYATMYDLLCQADRSAIPFETFRGRYLRAQTEATATAVQNELRAVLARGNSASASFRTIWQTSLFGPLSFENTLPLIWEGGRWVVDWSSALILPALGEDLTLVLLDRTASRGNIYERNGLGLAVQGKMVEIGVVPGRLPNDPGPV
ncbi:MAG: hypothetical protein NZ765_13395, partial [Anaerolineae bacterium]|nr:hypothetical protein [Anaerolineae bacterium]MDW8072503.1 NTF2-like N-terminal transpeptidase domain-containing protein [Anaerolineae bacterium]